MIFEILKMKLVFRIGPILKGWREVSAKTAANTANCCKFAR